MSLRIELLLHSDELSQLVDSRILSHLLMTHLRLTLGEERVRVAESREGERGVSGVRLLTLLLVEMLRLRVRFHILLREMSLSETERRRLRGVRVFDRSSGRCR